MLPASNRGSGENDGFPDTVNTYVGAATSPIPYPNMGENSLSEDFAETVMIAMVNAVNMSTIIPMTNGDEAGTAGPNMGQGLFTSGNPIILLEKAPAISLTSSASGNNGNCTVDAQLVPSTSNVLYTDARSPSGALDPYLDSEAWLGPSQLGLSLSGGVVVHLQKAGLARALGVRAGDRLLEPLPPFRGEEGERVHLSVDRAGERLSFAGAFGAPLSQVADLVWQGDELLVDVHLVTRDLARLVAHQLVEEEGKAAKVVLDLRGVPGGDLLAAVELVGLFVEEGTPVATWVDSDGDEELLRTRGVPLHLGPLTLLVDEMTASAAEVVAHALRPRATWLGGETFGKRSVTTVTGSERNAAGHIVFPSPVETP